MSFLGLIGRCFANKPLSLNRITVTKEKECFPVHIYPLLSTMDLQTKSYCLCLVPHNKDCGCSTCNIKLGKGHSKAYLFEDYKTKTERTAESFRQDAELANETGEKVNIIKLLLR